MTFLSLVSPLVMVTLMFNPGIAHAAEEREPSAGRSYSFYAENDSRTIGGPGTDEGYSNGFRFSAIEAHDHVPGWAKAFSENELVRQELEKSQVNFGLALGQQIYTPNNVTRTTLDVNDRPYAGWLYLSAMAHFKNENHGQVFEVSLGIVGPEALGEKVQNEYHRLIAHRYTQGWRNQLATEPALQLSYQQRVRFFELDKGGVKYFDVIPYYGAALGNVMTSAHVGGILRFGWHLPDDLGPTRPSSIDGDSFMTPAVSTSTEKWTYYGFLGARGNAVAKNIFLDGNTFRESHRVHKYPFNAETEFGMGLQYDPWSLIWRFVTRSPEFEEKSIFNSFASISLSYSTR